MVTIKTKNIKSPIEYDMILLGPDNFKYSSRPFNDAGLI